MNLNQQIISSIIKTNSHVCVGLDSRYDKLPDIITKNQSVTDAIYSFNKEVIDVTHDVSVMYKMNVAFYAGFGKEGLEALRKTNEYLQNICPDKPRIADCKRSEMGESVTMVKQEIFDWLGFSCVMVTPWFGFDTVKDYIEEPSRGACVYVHDSNPSAGEFQDLVLQDGRHVYEVVAEHVAKDWNKNGNVFAEAGATYPNELRKTREIIGPDMPLLVAGIGPQGGTVASLQGLFGKDTKRLIVNSSRGIIFAGIGKKDYFSAVRESARLLRESLLHAAIMK